MVKLTLYYPTFFEVENIENIVCDDIKNFLTSIQKDKAIKKRLFDTKGNLRSLYVYENNLPEVLKKGTYIKDVFLKTNGRFFGACIITGNKEDVSNALELLQVKTAKW